MDQHQLQERIDHFMSLASGYEALSKLAVFLAQQAGEEVKRPLSKAQLVRALHIHMEESETIRSVLAQYLDEVKIGDLHG